VEEGDMGKEVEEGGWWVYGKERASRIEGRGHGPAQSPLSADSFFPVLRLGIWIPPSHPSPGPGPAQIIHYSPPPSLFFRSLIVSAHTAPSVIPTLSRQLHLHSQPVHCSLLPHPVLCSFATSSALHRFASNPASEYSGVTYHRLLRHTPTGRPVSQGTEH
jgi:hypothetical protein